MNKKKRKSLKDIFNVEIRNTLFPKSKSLKFDSKNHEYNNDNGKNYTFSHYHDNKKVYVHKRNSKFKTKLNLIKRNIRYKIGTFLQRIANRNNRSINVNDSNSKRYYKKPSKNAYNKRPVHSNYDVREYPYGYHTSTVYTRRKLARRRRRTILKLKRIFFIGFVFVAVLLFVFIVHYKPFKVTIINGVAFRGTIHSNIEFVGINSKTVQTGKTYTFNVQKVMEDHFNNNVVENVDTSLININVTSENLKNKVKINKNTINIDDSVISGSTLNLVVSYNNVNESYSYTVKDNLSEEINKNMIITNPNDYDAVVNKKRHLSSSYKPSDLVKPNIDFMQSNESVMYLRKDAAKALEELFKGAESSGYKFYGVSGFRSYSLQVDVYKDNISQYGNEEDANFYSAKPGESEHQLGLSIDVSTKEVNYQLSESLGNTPAGKWLKENCYKYGFIIRFPEDKEKITGYSYEPWHIRYVGKDLAKIIHDNNITLEEYFESDKY